LSIVSQVQAKGQPLHVGSVMSSSGEYLLCAASAPQCVHSTGGAGDVRAPSRRTAAAAIAKPENLLMAWIPAVRLRLNLR
jgi:hypothetical protein